MKKTRILALMLACLLLLSACNKAPVTNDPSAVDPNAGKPVENQGTENTYTGPKDYRWWATSMATYNPHMYTNSKTFMNLGTFVAMVAKKDGSSQLDFVPHHASELPKSADGGTTWTVKIRDGLVWNDGTALNAKDYEYSMKMMLDTKLANKNAVYLFDTCIVKNAREYYKGEASWEDVGIKLVNDKELQITLQYPASELDFYTSIGTLIWPVQEKLYEQCMNADRTSTTYGTSIETTPSAGMFTLTEWITDGHDKYIRNDKDPLVQDGYVKLDTVTRRYISQNATREEMFFKNELDQHSLTGDAYLQYKNDPRAYPTLSANVWGYFVNGKSKNTIMQNKDFRNALYFGTPRESISSDVYKLYPPAPYIVSTAIVSGDPTKGTGTPFRETAGAKKNMETYKTDMDKAKELFNKAYEANGGKPVSVEYIYFEGQEDQKRQAEILQESFENLFGKDRFTMTLRAMPPASAYDVYRKGEYDLGLGVRLANIFNPWATMNVWTSSYADKYITGFESEEFDKLQFDCVYGELAKDTAGREKALARMEELLLDYGAFVPVMQNDNTVIYQDRIELPTQEYLPFVGYASNQIDIIAAP